MSVVVRPATNSHLVVIAVSNSCSIIEIVISRTPLSVIAIWSHQGVLSSIQRIILLIFSRLPDNPSILLLLDGVCSAK
jgi:hypothetical protein